MVAKEFNKLLMSGGKFLVQATLLLARATNNWSGRRLFLCKFCTFAEKYIIL